MNKDLQDLLNLRIENGQCVKGAAFTIPPKLEDENKARANDGLMTKKAVLSPLSSTQMELLHATHMAHVAVSNWRCGASAPAAGIVTRAHQAFEATAKNETEHHFFRMKDFAGAVDAGWSAAEVCALGRFQDDAHERWMKAVEALDLIHARAADNDHQMGHICMGVKDERVTTIRLSTCGMDKFEFCPPLNSCQELLAPYLQSPGSPAI